jgi:o-succinylbenzoate synthase
LRTDFSALANSGLTLIRAQYQPYRVAFRTAWRSALGSHTDRRGYLLRLETGQAITGYGECAPLPEAGTETLAEAELALQAVLRDGGGGSVAAMADRLGSLTKSPAARCALETALLDICARQQAVPLYRWLARGATGQVTVNAACGCLDEGFGARLRQAIALGYRVLKIKLGLYPLDEELGCLKRLHLPQGMRLRLDANRVWSAEQAARAIDVCGALPVDSLEEPLQSPDLATMRWLQQQALFPLALDESLTDVFADIPAEELPVQRLVMKPVTSGGVLPLLERARRARQAGIDTVVTSTLETSVGLWAAVHAAAALDNQLAHGLGTAAWFEKPDLALSPVQGVLQISQQAGPGLPPPAGFSFAV